MTTIRMFEVGGCVRDRLLGIKTKDIDFAVEAPSFDAMREHLVGEGFQIFVETPNFLTIRAHFPNTHPMHGKTTADFVLCRTERGSLDGRHPEHVEPADIFADLARRDFTVNAMALPLESSSLEQIIDPHNGRGDLRNMTLRFVGDPDERLNEDGLRAFRAVRFCITKGFTMDPLTFRAIQGMPCSLVNGIVTERIRDELHRPFHTNTNQTIHLLQMLNLDSVFDRADFWLMPTQKGKP